VNPSRDRLGSKNSSPVYRSGQKSRAGAAEHALPMTDDAFPSTGRVPAVSGSAAARTALKRAAISVGAALFGGYARTSTTGGGGSVSGTGDTWGGRISGGTGD